jgi:hypothetical protein
MQQRDRTATGADLQLVERFHVAKVRGVASYIGPALAAAGQRDLDA